MNNEKHHHSNEQSKKVFTRKAEDLALKNKLLSEPELFITDKGSDEYLDKLALKAKLFKSDLFSVDAYVAEAMTMYETKFHKYWYYALADLFQVPRSVMDVWVKPDFVRLFTIQAVYGRFPYFMLRELRKRKIKAKDDSKRLYHYLTKNASDQLDIVIEQVYQIMKGCKNPLEFWMTYSKEYKVYFQTELF